MQCGRVGSRPLSTTEGSQGLAPWEPSLHLRPTPSPETHPQPLPPKGGEWNAQGRRQASRPRASAFSWGQHVANDCRVVVCIRQWGRASCPIAGGVPRIRLQGHPLRPIAEAVPFAGPKEMIDSFSNDPHIWRMPIMHYALPIQRRLF